MTNIDGPFEPPDGQDGPPDLLTALRALRGFLEDMTDHPAIEGDLLLRVLAHRRALRRLIEARQGEE